MSRKLHNSKESNLHVTLKKRSVTGIAEKDRTKISFFGEVSQASRASQFKQARQAKSGRIYFSEGRVYFPESGVCCPKGLVNFPEGRGSRPLFVCHCLLLLTAICSYVLSSAAVCSCVILFAAVSCWLPLAVVCRSSQLFSTFAAACCCLLPFAAICCCFLLSAIVCCCLPLLLPLARFARNFNPITMAKMSPEASNLLQNEP